MAIITFDSFNRSGIAAISDLQSEEWETIFHFLETEQRGFLELEDLFRSVNYKWPRDPLHTWSRVWEYPYTYFHLKQMRKSIVNEELLNVIDLGSGVTFFPFSIAQLGYHVTCVDVDPIVGTDLAKAIEVIDCKPGIVDYKIIENTYLPFSDKVIDTVYCISVLEHEPKFEWMVEEVARILKPGGLFILTIDLDMRGNQEISKKRYKDLMLILQKYFYYDKPVRTVHPIDVLLSTNSPFPAPKQSMMRYLLRQAKRIMLFRPLLFREGCYLTVEGSVLRRN